VIYTAIAKIMVKKNIWMGKIWMVTRQSLMALKFLSENEGNKYQSVNETTAT